MASIDRAVHVHGVLSRFVQTSTGAESRPAYRFKDPPTLNQAGDILLPGACCAAQDSWRSMTPLPSGSAARTRMHGFADRKPSHGQRGRGGGKRPPEIDVPPASACFLGISPVNPSFYPEFHRRSKSRKASPARSKRHLPQNPTTSLPRWPWPSTAWDRRPAAAPSTAVHPSFVSRLYVGNQLIAKSCSRIGAGNELGRRNEGNDRKS